MQTERRIGEARRSRELAQRIAALQGPCIGCEGCRGLCTALIEALTLPEAVLNRGA